MYKSYIKRPLDLVVSTFLLLILSPLLFIIAVIIKFTSKGPVIYKGVRSGLHNEQFEIFKFRTMIEDAELKGGGTTALNDPRIIPFGNFLRKYKLDELPQLINVFLSQMSLVGPRPELPFYTKNYSSDEKRILTILPGITDLSSVRFSSLDEIVGEKNADEEFEKIVLKEKNYLRLQYVDNVSFSLDIKIIIMTFTCIIKKLFKT